MAYLCLEVAEVDGVVEDRVDAGEVADEDRRDQERLGS